AQPVDVPGAADAVRTLDHDQPAGEVAQLQAGHRLAVRFEALHAVCSSPSAAVVGDAVTPRRCGATSSRRARCCSSTGSVASIVARPYSGTRPSYSRWMRAWNSL